MEKCLSVSLSKQQKISVIKSDGTQHGLVVPEDCNIFELDTVTSWVRVLSESNNWNKWHIKTCKINAEVLVLTGGCRDVNIVEV